jgi:hypothetical protein
VNRQYVFSDESGDLNFKVGRASSRHFAVGTLTIDERELGHLRTALARLRDGLAWKHHGLDSYFHATMDSPAIRALVFVALQQIEFRVDVTLIDKANAQIIQQETDRPSFFGHVWERHLGRLAPTLFKPDDAVLVVAAELGTRRERHEFRRAIEKVMRIHLPYRVKRALAFWPAASDFAIQAVDYCLWAVFRKWERDDDTYYRLIAKKLASEHLLAGRVTRPEKHEPPPS